MPRSGRGGLRQAREGTLISNRTDLAAAPRRTAAHVEEAAAEQPVATVSDLPSAGGAPMAMPNVGPDVPTMYPDRPLTHGMPFGPGAGPEVLGEPVTLSPVERLRRMYRANPNPDLLELLMLAEAQDA